MTMSLQSALLGRAGFRHAYFTRLGGVSSPPWDSLNFSTGTGDSTEAVGANLERAAAELRIEARRVYFLRQVHGCEHRVLAGSEDREALLCEEGDITVTHTAGVGCGVRTADCAPVLVAQPSSGAVAAIHAGWRGTVAGVVAAGVEALRALSGRSGALVAAVGPHIERCCFEVGRDVAEQLAEASALGRTVVDDSGPKPHVDLRGVIEAQLRASGVAVIDHVRGCTVCDAARFHSYRRDGRRGGRMLAVIVGGGEGPTAAPDEHAAG